MDMDDLLGTGSPPPKSGGGGDPMDDLLGGGPASPPKGPAFDDDLLFGGGSSAPPPPPPAAQAQAQQAKQQAQPGGPPQQQQQRGGGAGAPMPIPKQVAPVNAPPVTQCTQMLSPFVKPGALFVRFVQQFNPSVEQARTRRVLALTSTHMYVLADETKKGDDPKNPVVSILREVPVYAIIGVIRHVGPSGRKGATSGEVERRALVQIRNERDLALVFHQDDHNGGMRENFCEVLTAICASYKIVLPVSMLKKNEKLTDFYNPYEGADDRLRAAVNESLAYRSDILDEHDELQKDETKIDMQIGQIKASAEGQTASAIAKDIEEIETIMADKEEQFQELEEEKAAAKREIAELRAALVNEARRREEAVSNDAEEHSQQLLMKKMAEYELVVAAHQREMDMATQLTNFYERRVKEQKSQSYNMQTIPLRIDDLEEQLEFVQSRVTEKGEAHTKKLKALTENRRRKAMCPDLIETLKEDAKLIKGAPLTESLPTKVSSLELPDLDPVVPQAAKPQPPPKAGSTDDLNSGGAAAPAAKPKPAVELSPDEPPLNAPQTNPGPANKPAINLDSDDDI